MAKALRLPRWNIFKARWAEYDNLTDQIVAEDLISKNVAVSAAHFTQSCTQMCP